MTKEDIEKAAGDYSGSSLGFTEVNSVMAKHKAFADGANWRIESVYHNISELPNDGEMILALATSNIPIICGPNNSDFLKTLKDLGIVKWAYMKDLIPSK